MPRDQRLFDDPVPAHRDAFGRKRYRTTHTYVVLWPDNVMKVGIAGDDTRWRKFTSKGASLIALFAFDRARDAIDLETLAGNFVAGLGRPAFESRLDAVSHLGSGGGGYLECTQLSDPNDIERVRDFLIAYREGISA